MKKKTTLRIGINEIGGEFWTGGITYRKNLLEALKLIEGVEIYLIKSKSGINLGVPESHLIINEPPRNKILSLINKISLNILKRHLFIDIKLKNKIDVVFPSNLKFGHIPIISWIPDFQFMHLPDFFTAGQLKQYQNLKNTFHRFPIIVLSSEDARNDFKTYAPEFLHKTRLLKFVAHVPQNIYDVDPSILINKYNIPESFVFMPNQFWAHKNHTTVIRALEILKERNIFPVIICTGNPVDRRNPSYLGKMLEMLSKAGVRSQVILLGLIEHEDVYVLIRQAKFVLNPSYFEGWSTTVEESKSIGKRMLLSNLNVHIEQNPPLSKYFDPYSPVDLANKLQEMWEETQPGPDLELEKAARVALPERMKAYATAFKKIVEEII